MNFFNQEENTQEVTEDCYKFPSNHEIYNFNQDTFAPENFNSNQDSYDPNNLK
jgi:hypothetical protein